MFAGCVALQKKEEEKGVFNMKNLIMTLVAVALLATPAWAVTITLEDLGDGVIQIGYDATDEAELVRAFALDITATDGNIIDINDYSVGDDIGGYGIFPGNFAAAPIAVNPTTGLVDNWEVAGYTPVAPAGDPDALGDIPGPGITIEMGSLYETAGPGDTGILCTITVDCDVTEVCVTGNAIRGNVVLESAAEATLPAEPVCIQGAPTFCGDICYPQLGTHAAGRADFEAYMAEDKDPSCWCNPYQCDGDADNATETFFKYRVFGNDLALVVENWRRKIDHADIDPCADFDHKSETFFKYRVFGDDLALVVENWRKKDADLAGDCPRAD